MDKLTWFCFALSLLISIYEFVGVLMARLRNTTHSTRRVVSRGTVFLTLAVLLWQHIDWRIYLTTLTSASLEHVRVNNIPYVVCNIAIALISVLVVRELVSFYRAKKQGLTKNTSRFVSSLVILLCLFPILQSTITMWDRYTDALSNVKLK